MTVQLVNSLGGAPSNQAPSPSTPAAWAISLEALYTEQFNSLVAVAVRIVQERSLAEECVQDVFLAYHLKQPVHAPGKALAYLRSMTRNAAVSIVRREARQRRELPGAIDIAPAADLSVVAGISGEELAAKVTQLPRRQRQVVTCRFDGMSVNETADVLDISSGSVKTHRFRAAAAIRRSFDSPVAA